ncbi:MAG TPA: glycosyltransferase family 9 protein [Candidatus Methylacidiphilales bacterium]
MPRRVYQGSSQVWHKLLLLERTFRLGLPKMLIYFGLAPGDDLLCTAVFRELRKRGRKRIWMMSNYASLFEGRQDVERVIPVEPKDREYALSGGARFLRLEYSRFDVERDQSVPPKRHIIAELCAQLDMTGEVALRPYLSLTEAERASASWADGMVATQSSGLVGTYPMKNKQWYPERFQAVVDSFAGNLKFVQLGSLSDPLLTDVIDLRGKTSLRETAAVLANCRLYVGNVGFLMHLARAMECASVIVYGGREAPWQSGYSCNINLYSDLSCAPCWLWNTCEYDRLCMRQIEPAEVSGAIDQLLGRPRGPLIEDKVRI